MLSETREHTAPPGPDPRLGPSGTSLTPSRSRRPSCGSAHQPTGSPARSVQRGRSPPDFTMFLLRHRACFWAPSRAVSQEASELPTRNQKAESLGKGGMRVSRRQVLGGPLLTAEARWCPRLAQGGLEPLDMCVPWTRSSLLVTSGDTAAFGEGARLPSPCICRRGGPRCLRLLRRHSIKPGARGEAPSAP